MPEDHAQPNRPPLERSKSLIERWACEVEKCRNHGQLCYWTVSDTADDHLPVTSVIMQFWLAAIARRECTVDSPPLAVIEQWQCLNLRKLEQKIKRREQRTERQFARNPSSPRASFWRQQQNSRAASRTNSAAPTRPEQGDGDSVEMGIG
jgi:hypothetical protein